MKVRVSYTIDVADRHRRAINLYFGNAGLADRQTVKDWYERHGDSEDDDLDFDLQSAIERGEIESEHPWAYREGPSS